MKVIVNIRTLLSLVLLFVCVSVLGQPKIQSYVGLYFSGDASMYYIGPSYKLGFDVPLSDKFLMTGYGHYFSASVAYEKYKVYTLGAMIQYNIGKRGKWYIAIGVAYQDAKEEAPFVDKIDRSIFIPSYRLGYTIGCKKYLFFPEIFTTGPYNYGGSTDIFTLPSVGIRIQRQSSR